MIIGALISFIVIRSDAEKILSLDLCADQWLLWLFPHEEIAAITHLAKDPHISYFAERAQGLPTHDGRIETILQRGATTVIADSYIDPHKEMMLKKMGIKVIVLPPLNSIDTLAKRIDFLLELYPKLSTLLIDAKASIHRLKKKFLKAKTKGNAKRKGIFLTMGGLVAGPKTFLSEWLLTESIENSHQYRLHNRGWEYTTLEEIFSLEPQLILCNSGPKFKASSHLLSCHHPLVKKKGIPTCDLTPAFTYCLLPPILSHLSQELARCHEEAHA